MDVCICFGENPAIVPSDPTLPMLWVLGGTILQDFLKRKTASSTS